MVDILDQRDRARLGKPLDVLEDAAPGDRDHHHARRSSVAQERRDGQIEGLSEDDLLEGHAGAERERARAETADRARGDLDHPGPGPPVLVPADPELGMHGPLRQPERLRRVLRTGADGGLRLLGEPRGRDVDRLLEERSVQRIRLVEQREGVQLAADQQPLERHFRARDEFFHEDPVGALAQLEDLRRGQNRRDPFERGDELRLIKSADDAAARREDERLEHARVAHSRGGDGRDIRGAPRGERRGRHARTGQQLAHPELVPRRLHRRQGTRAQAEVPADRRRGHGREVIHGHHGVERTPGGKAPHLLDGGSRSRQRQGEQVIRELPGHHVGAIGGDHQVHVELPRRLDEVLGAVGRGGNQQEQAFQRHGQVYHSRQDPELRYT